VGVWIPCQQIAVALEESLKQTSGSVFSDVFAFPEALPVPARLRLAALMAAPGQPTAILPRQLASSPLPADPEARAEIRTAIEAGVTAQAIESLAPHRLDAVVPALARCDPGATARSLPSPVRVLLAKHATEAAPLGGFTIGRIRSWPGFGPRRVVQLIGAAVGAALEVAAGQPVPIVVNPTPSPTPDDIATVLAYDATKDGQLRGLLENLCTAGPPEVAMAARRMLASSTVEPDRRLTVLAEALAAAGDERDRGVFENAVLPLGPPVPRPELADALGISADRINRLASRAAQRVNAALNDPPSAVRELAAAVSGRLGAASPRTAADEMLACLGLPALPDARSRLLLWMAGPYREVDGHSDWVAVDPAGLVGQTRRLIHEDGGVRPVDHVAKELRIEGIVAEHVEGWLARQPVRVSDGLVVAMTGRPGDVAERALHAHGRAMTVDEIAAWVHGVPRGFEELRSAPDRRFVVIGGEALALVEWGEWGADPAPDPDRDPRSTTDTATAGGPAAEEPPIAHYPDGHGTRVSLVPASRPALAVR